MTNDNDWPEGHAEFVAYCHAHPEALLSKTPFGWFQAGLRAGRDEALNKAFEPLAGSVGQPFMVVHPATSDIVASADVSIDRE